MAIGTRMEHDGGSGHSHSNQSWGSGSDQFYQNSASHSSNSSSNGHNNFIQNLIFAEAKSVRTSIIVLAAFNVLIALATATTILFERYMATRKTHPSLKNSKFNLSSIHPAETFPLILSVAIAIQGIVFAVVQGQGLLSLEESGCAELSQFVWPALYLVVYAQLVFGVECAIRSLRAKPFQPRGKYDVAICLALIVVMLVGAWVPVHLKPQTDVCFASLLWFVSDFGPPGFAMFTTCLVGLCVSGSIIYYRLKTLSVINQHQRIAASRMVYYMVLGAVSLAFIIPYFITLTIGDMNLTASMIATVVLQLSGFTNGFLYIFLRSNTGKASFGPTNLHKWSHSDQVKIWGANELAFSSHLNEPINTPTTQLHDLKTESRSGSQSNLIDPEKGPEIASPQFNSLYSPTIHPSKEAAPLPTVQSIPPSARRKDSYSIFPAEPGTPKMLLIPEESERGSVFSTSDLVPPPLVFDGAARKHQRQSSALSSATLQFALRLSHAPTFNVEDEDEIPLPPITYDIRSKRPPPALLEVQPAPSPKRSSPLVPKSLPSTPLSRSDSLNKTLPPTPSPADEPESLETQNPDSPPLSPLPQSLSPTVYSPEKKVIVPSTLRRSPTFPAPAIPLPPNPLARPRNNSHAVGPPQASKAEWI